MWAVLGAGLVAAPGQAAITGVCPDGSMFIVQSAEAIPCPEAKRVSPHELPPLKPEYLPRPYGWQQHQQRHDPNNPYNLIDSVRRERAARQPQATTGVRAPQRLSPVPPPQAQSPPRPPLAPRAAAAARAPGVALSAEERRDLFLIVELSQEDAPASFSHAGANGQEALYIALAQSPSFADRLRRQRPGAAGQPVVLFSAMALVPGEFHGNFLFAQGPHAYHPDHADPDRFGVLEGELGALQSESVVLGYVVLPEGFDLSQPLDIYWNDWRLETTLARPRS
ncbi:MAG: mannose-6-phosphate isomerase [Proteobacteria bacterium]|nr:mannose-6-phosphate isomerase [Pseudomonadota bacterium]